MNRIIKRILDVIFIILIIILIGYFVLRSCGVLEIYEVETGSMEQGIHAGDYVLICKKDKYVIGDIVTYKKDNYFITHRIVKSVSGNIIITKGDANNTEDEEININSIEGKVIYNGGLLNTIIDYKYGIVSLFLGVYLLSCYFGGSVEDKNKETTKELNESEIILPRKRLKKSLRSKYR